MGRPERPVDPEAGAVQRLAHQLRELRAACGGPSYRVMARRAHYSAPTLAQAAERLPSLAVVLAYVQACGADPGEWETRWKAAAEAERAVRQEGSGGGDEPPYRGLVRFEPGDESLFSGRDRLVGELLELVCEHRLAMVFGASGSGKSSLLRAGLIPRLRRRIEGDGCAAVLRVLTPGATPAATHGHLLTPGDGEAFSPDSGAFAYGVSTPGRDAAPQRLTVWNVTGDRARTTLDITSSSAGTAVALALGPGGRTLLAARTPGTPHLTDEVWDVTRHRRTAVLKGFDSHLLALRPDGRLLVGGSHSAALPAGPVTARALGQSGRIGALAFGADGSWS
ncbi:helix-turn-helix domain-containing protein [Streptomyces sp. NPDC048504]|uniref:nSTAND1 domain-containing NTPase n=1 Tax=Streptomyces sp. NPDC048504 TaxID=3365559 RepID=UPI003710C38B